MNELRFQIMILHSKIKENIKMSKGRMALVGVCSLFSFCYSLGASSMSDILAEGQDILTTIVWMLSMTVLIVSFFIDSKNIKKNKAYEFEIYNLEIEDLKIKKEIAEIRGEILPDYVLNRQIDMPTEKVSRLPLIYYSIMLVFGIIIRIKLIP